MEWDLVVKEFDVKILTDLKTNDFDPKGDYFEGFNQTPCYKCSL